MDELDHDVYGNHFQQFWSQREIMETNEVVHQFWALRSDDPDFELE